MDFTAEEIGVGLPHLRNVLSLRRNLNLAGTYRRVFLEIIFNEPLREAAVKKDKITGVVMKEEVVKKSVEEARNKREEINHIISFLMKSLDDVIKINPIVLCLAAGELVEFVGSCSSDTLSLKSLYECEMKYNK